MIRQSRQFDLGQDKTRIKDPRDAIRQAATVDALLERFFHRNPNHRWEIQILADEVGMGKTFVALGTAFSVLEAMRDGDAVDDLSGCYQKVLIITPNNSALFSKWRQEVGEFVKRCVKPEHRDQAGRWFAAAPVDRIDDLTYELRRPGAAPRVIVANMRIFGGGQLRNYDLKRRYLLGILFRHWGVRFKGEQRERLLKGAPDGWPANPGWLHEFTDREWEQLHFAEDELLAAVRQLDHRDECVEKLLEMCREIAVPYTRNRDEMFAGVERQLVYVYRELMAYLINRSLPLVIVDEAHNWKNGPTSGSNGYEGFTTLIGCRARRALLVTATPFQLRPSEMLEILKVGEVLRTCPTEVASAERQSRLRQHREAVIEPVLKCAERASRRFSKAWSKLPQTVTRQVIQSAWESGPVAQARSRLRELARQTGVVKADELEHTIDLALSDVHPDVRQLLREGLRLFVYNSDLSCELGALVIRHRRRTEHRLFRVGNEYQAGADRIRERPDRHVLHAAPGVDVLGEGELPHYLLMRCVSEMKGGKGRSSLGSALTGCYSTLIDSSEGRAVKTRLGGTEVGGMYLDLLMRMVGQKQDPKHPKVREVVEAVLRNWKAGEKTLIFCFRTNTANRLHDIIDRRIHDELKRRQDRCMGGPESLRALRTRLTGRDRDLVVLGLDRVLWSVIWTEELASLAERRITPDDLEVMDHELPLLAALGLRYRVDLLAERVDRVFLNRACEHLIAQRLLGDLRPKGQLKLLLGEMAEDSWVSRPYGLLSDGDEGDDGGGEAAHFDERGAHSTYEERDEPADDETERIARELQERRLRARKQGQTAVLDVYERGPSLWLGANPRLVLEQASTESGTPIAKTLAEMHRHLFSLMQADNQLDWNARRIAMQAVRRVVLRESVLLRLLPETADRDETWGELLVKSFYAPLPQQRECMADRIAVFLEDLTAASGSITDQQSARFALYDATRRRDQTAVALVSGNTDSRTRERVFSGFNTPLLPEVLICTSVGQEGIDLHRHCRHVVHFDLAWNPAVLEQRTGRADRIGSKTFRERALSDGPISSFLEIGVPYLAGTYDERMYEELRLRAQTFEVLTGGDLAADDVEGFDDRKKSEGKEEGLRFVALPDGMVEQLRVSLHVWSDERANTPTPPDLPPCAAGIVRQQGDDRHAAT